MSKRKNSRPQVISLDGEEIVIKSQIGYGGNSKIYMCNYQGKSYVIKFFNGKSKKRYKRFQQEVQKIGDINEKISSFTPGVIASKIPQDYMLKQKGKDAIDFQNTPFYIMEKGGNYNYIGKKFPDKLKDILEICTSLKKLHQNGFQHRDVKPENIVRYNGILTFIDFGTTRVPGIETVDENEGMGSNGTKAPEMNNHAKGLSEYKYEYADVYSLGKTIWIILTEDRRADKFTTYESANESCKITIPNIHEGIVMILEQIIHNATAENYLERISLDDVISTITYIKDELLYTPEKCNFVKYEYLLKKIYNPMFDANIIESSEKQFAFLQKIENVGVNLKLCKNGELLSGTVVSNFKIIHNGNNSYEFELNDIKFIFQIKYILIKNEEVVIFSKEEVVPELEAIQPLSKIPSLAVQSILIHPVEDIDKKIYLDCEISLIVEEQIYD